MKHELIERTAREWVHGNASRGARELDGLAGRPISANRSPQEIADELIRRAGAAYLERTRAW